MGIEEKVCFQTQFLDIKAIIHEPCIRVIIKTIIGTSMHYDPFGFKRIWAPSSY